MKIKPFKLSLSWIISLTIGIILIRSVIGASPDFRIDLTEVSIRISHLAANEEFTGALSIIDSLISEYPDEPVVNLLKASIFYSRLKTYNDFVDNEELRRVCSKVEKLSGERNTSGSNQAEINFCLGSVWVYRSQMSLFEGHKLKAVQYGLRAGKCFEKAVQVDSTYWDAYLGLGSYYFYRSQSSGAFIRHLPIFEDKRQIGWRLVEIAAEKGTISKLTARFALAWIALAKEDYQDAINRSQVLLRQYPRSRSLIRCLARAQFKLEMHEEAIETYTELIRASRSDRRNNHFDEIEALNAIAKTFITLGHWNDAYRLSQEALFLELAVDVQRRQAKPLKNLQAIMKESGKKRSK